MPHTARHGSDSDGEWAGNEDGDTTDGGGGSDGSLWSSVDVLTAFVNNPRGFVLGAVLTTIIETVTGV